MDISLTKRPVFWGFVTGAMYIALINGPHIQCCHTVPSVAYGALVMGGISALVAWPLGVLWQKKPMPLSVAASLGYIGFALAYFGRKYYDKRCREIEYEKIRRSGIKYENIRKL